MEFSKFLYPCSFLFLSLSKSWVSILGLTSIISYNYPLSTSPPWYWASEGEDVIIHLLTLSLWGFLVHYTKEWVLNECMNKLSQAHYNRPLKKEERKWPHWDCNERHQMCFILCQVRKDWLWFTIWLDWLMQWMMVSERKLFNLAEAQWHKFNINWFHWITTHWTYISFSTFLKTWMYLKGK